MDSNTKISDLTDDQIGQIARAVSIEGAQDELIEMASALLESAMMVHKIPCDFEGVSFNLLRDPDTHKLLAMIVTPVDVINDVATPRFDAQSRVAVTAPKLIIPS